MKRALSLFLVMTALISLASCNIKDKDPSDTTSPYVDYDDLGIVSEDRFTAEQLFTLTHSKGDVNLESEYTAIYNADGSLDVISFDNKDIQKYENGASPFGIKVGDSLYDFEKAFSLDAGFAAFGVSGGYFQEYSSVAKHEIPEGGQGNIYVGFAKDREGNWAFMDYSMLTLCIEGKMSVVGTSNYPVMLFCCTADHTGAVTSMVAIRGEVNNVMKFLAGGYIE